MAGVRLSQAKKATEALLKRTLLDADYATVILFSYVKLCLVFPPPIETLTSDTKSSSNEVKTLDKSLFLLRMTDENRDKLIAWVNGERAYGDTNYEIAIDAAFDVIERSLQAGKANDCQTGMGVLSKLDFSLIWFLFCVAILFMSDGEITSGATGNALFSYVAVHRLYSSRFSHLQYRKIKERNSGDWNVRFFTYAFGDEADQDTLARLACEHGGTFSHVPDRYEM